MKLKLPSTLFATLLIFAYPSCGENKALVAKREQQKAEIAKLRGEVTLLEAQVKNMPPDVSRELEIAKKQTETNNTEISRLETQIKDLENRKTALQEELGSYRVKYPIQ